MAAAKLQGTTVSPETPRIAASFADILDSKPAFEILTVFTPIGLPDEPTPGGRQCDQEARRVLGWPRSGAISSPPCRPALRAGTFAAAWEANGGHLSALTWGAFPKIAEVDGVIAPYWQRSVFEVHPELSFYQLNEDAPLRTSRRSEAGVKERTALLLDRLGGAERILDHPVPGSTLQHRIDAAVCLWTARRIASRAIVRIPENPVWDSLGLRMEIVR